MGIIGMGMADDVVDLKNTPSLFDNDDEDLLRDLCKNGLACQVLNLTSSKVFQKLNMVGSFQKLHTLNLDFCTSLTILEKDCFACMPNLSRLSMCETRVSNIWTTSAALYKLHSLVELRFQNCLCCKGTAPCPVSSSGNSATRTITNKYHPSPICFEKNYRNYMITVLPGLIVLDNILIGDLEKKTAKKIYLEYYESSPYNRRQRERIIDVLGGRQIGRKSQCYYSRSLSAAKLGSSAWPVLCPLLSNSLCNTTKGQEENKGLRPRQFEYHPSNCSLMALGTLDGELFVINHENGRTLGQVQTNIGSESSILGLCWLKNHPSKLLSGSDNGSLRLYDIQNMLTNDSTVDFNKYDKFEQLTSVHANSTDNRFVASGYSRHVALYDVESEKRLQLLADVHNGPINVAKFANHSPSLFVTSSFDGDVKMWDLRQEPTRSCYVASSSRGNVMVCFSPDDLYLLVSSVDNEVKQLLAVDGRVHMKIEIDSTGSCHNYTRSYYMNGRDYVISGSSEESAVRVCCGRTGRRLRDIHLEGSRFVQSLRGDPFRDFHMAILASYKHPRTELEIMKVNMLASNQCGHELLPQAHHHSFYPCSCLGA
ncbi:uncharacterized protein LOC124914710 [Impatiens glandulifera]|uniref:uncharacterized protein LOC124914710 n=1 Tax=Impatiens glandulifera TaxID=253017 RepID=UPI001FB125B0|nr:uncharacterized protein LOC124914710 [Impatiens glandulifera]